MACKPKPPRKPKPKEGLVRSVMMWKSARLDDLEALPGRGFVDLRTMEPDVCWFATSVPSYTSNRTNTTNPAQVLCPIHIK